MACEEEAAAVAYGYTLAIKEIMQCCQGCQNFDSKAKTCKIHCPLSMILGPFGVK